MGRRADARESGRVRFDEKGRLFVAETYRYRTSVLDIRHYMFMLEDDLASRTIDDRDRLHPQEFPKAGRSSRSKPKSSACVEDTDGDGKADTTRVYADGFNTPLDGIASGVLARHGKVWFTNMPNLWLLAEGADGKAEKRELCLGYGVRFSFTGHDLHGLAMGRTASSTSPSATAART